ncbi:DUF3611 family protein [Leptolyngbya ohadii]|uniref:DUF3611 family protein n=1 Tax=Leptolyngbya ohadii TaxID=1962290 RepID=UPI000B59E82E|nr:DUF3611 family protein [Leptolyngbya ohadii]
MLNFFDPEAPNPKPHEIAHAFRWLGWTGLGLQSLLGFLPILVLIGNILAKPTGQTGGWSFGLWLAIACLIILGFSIYWCFRYIQVGNRLPNRNLRPAKANVIRDLKIGLLANIGIMAIALLVALSRVGTLTVKMLTLPQGATVVAPNQIGTTLGPAGALITPSNMIAIQAMLHTIAAGLVGAVVALLLLFLVGQHRSSDD